MNQYIDFSTHSGLWSYNIGLSIPRSVVRSLLVASGGGKQWGPGSLFWFITQHHSNMLFDGVDQKYTFLSSPLKHSSSLDPKWGSGCGFRKLFIQFHFKQGKEMTWLLRCQMSTENPWHEHCCAPSFPFAFTFLLHVYVCLVCVYIYVGICVC